MRIQDFLRPYLDGVSRVVEVHSGSLNLRAYLELPDGLGYERRAPGDTPSAAVATGADVLPIGLFGPDRERHGREEDALALLRELGEGGRCVILFGYPAATLPLHVVLDELTAARAQLLQLSSLEHQHLHSAAMVVRVTDAIGLPLDPFGQGFGRTGDGDPDLAGLLRLANEYVLLDFVSRNLRSRLFRLDGGRVDQDQPAMPRSTGAHEPTAEQRLEADQARAAVDLARAELDQARAETRAARSGLRQSRTEAELARADAEALRSEVRRIRLQLARLTGSTSFAVGRVLVEAARHPQTAPRVPVDLVRLWRNRPSASAQPRPAEPAAARPKVTGPTRASTSRQATDGARPPSAGARPSTPPEPAEADWAAEQRRFLAHTAFAMGPRSRPIIAALVTDPTAGSLGVDAVVNRIGPNDARMVIERTEPDVLLVEAAALGPGHPWAFGADPAGVDRTATLIQLIDQVHALGRIAVLARDRHSSAVAGLVTLESRFDLVLDAEATPASEAGWTRGVQLSIFNPVGAPRTRDPRPLVVGAIPPRDPLPQRRLAERALAAMAEEDLDVRAEAHSVEATPLSAGELDRSGMDVVHWRESAELFRKRLVALASPFTVSGRVHSIDPRTLEQLACGTRVVSGPNTALLAAMGSHVTFVDEPERAGEALRVAREAGPPDPDGVMRLLRILFERHATAVMLSWITRRVPSVPDPRTSRSAAAVVSIDRSINRTAVIESLIRQLHRPAEAIIVVNDSGAWPTGAASALEAAGIAVRTLEAHDRSCTWGEVADVARSEWLVRWPGSKRVGAFYLLDLMIGAEISRADGIGYEPGEALRYISAIDLGSGLVRRSVAADALAGRGLDDDDRRLASLERSGLRLLSIGSENPG